MINLIVGTLASQLKFPSSVDQTYRLVNPQDVGLKNTGKVTAPGDPPEYVLDAMFTWSKTNEDRAAMIDRMAAAIDVLIAECRKSGKWKIVVDAECLVPVGKANQWGWRMSDEYWLLYRRVAMGLLPMVLDRAKRKYPQFQFTVYNLPQGFTTTVLSNEPFPGSTPTPGVITDHLAARAAWYDGCNLEARPLAAACFALTPCCYLPRVKQMAMLDEHLRYAREIVSYCRHLYPGKKVLPFISPFIGEWGSTKASELADVTLSRDLITELRQAGANDVCVWGYLPDGKTPEEKVEARKRVGAVQDWLTGVLR